MVMGQHMPERVYFVRAEFDSEAEVWYVSQTDVPGLAVEAGTPEELLALLDTLIPEMIESNGDDGSSYIPYSVMLDHLRAERVTA